MFGATDDGDVAAVEGGVKVGVAVVGAWGVVCGCVGVCGCVDGCGCVGVWGWVDGCGSVDGCEGLIDGGAANDGSGDIGTGS
jgi:hypothetical protein